MISELSIKGFKCFKERTMQLSPLTLLTGINGAGKSTVIQALLLAHLAETMTSEIPLNGVLGLRLGQALDVMRGDTIEISVVANESIGRWVFSARTDGDLTLQVESRQSVPELTQVSYLQAERLGPRDMLTLDSAATEFPTVGVSGEFVAHVLARLERTQVSAAVVRPTGIAHDGAPPTLLKQVEAWLQELVPGIELRVESHPLLSCATVRLRRSGHATEWLRPQNIGFGVSYVLPIIVAALTARPGSLLIVENPEAHLHPRGQSRIASFLARVATTGVAILVETHSDHVLNGIRLAVVDSNHPASPESVRIVHMAPGVDDPEVIEISVSKRGGLSASPPGFFDQSEQDLEALLKARNGQ